MLEIIRIYPLSIEEFTNTEAIKYYFQNTLKEKDGKFLYRNKLIKAETGTLVVFQFQGYLVAQAKLLEIEKYKIPMIRNNVMYCGHFLFDSNTISYYRNPISASEFYKIYPDKHLNRVMHILDNKEKNKFLLELIDNKQR